MTALEAGDVLQPELTYAFTNETLPAIMAGLEPCGGDNVLTVGTDQAFALLEKAGGVTLVDIDPAYIALATARTKALLTGDFDRFLAIGICVGSKSVLVKRRNEYFKEAERLQRIRARLRNLTIATGDVVTYARTGRFNKIYVSNSLGYFLYPHPEEVRDALIQISANLPVGTLVYVTLNCSGAKPQAPKVLEIDDALTRKAGNLEETDFWSPSVYRRIS